MPKSSIIVAKAAGDIAGVADTVADATDVTVGIVAHSRAIDNLTETATTLPITSSSILTIPSLSLG